MTDSKAVTGRNMTASIKVGELFYPVFCAKSCSFDLTNEIIERTGVNDGLFYSRRVRRTDWSGSATGVIVTDNTNDRYSPFYLLQEAVRRSENEWEFAFTNEDNETKTIIGTALIEGINLTGDINSFGQATVNIIGTGGFEIDESQSTGGTDENVDSDYWTTVAGEYAISGNSVNTKSLVGKTLLAVGLRGNVYDIITSGTPTNLQAKFSTLAGSITFDSSIPFESGDTVWAMWKD